jgi:enoyl-CoA hydratase
VTNTYEQIELSVESNIATIKLNRPERFNALGNRILEELGRALDEIEVSEDVRAVILTGTGDRAFCSGVDLKERREMDADERWAHNRALNTFSERLARI